MLPTPRELEMFLDDFLRMIIILISILLLVALCLSANKSTATETTNPPAYHCVCNPETP